MKESDVVLLLYMSMTLPFLAWVAWAIHTRREKWTTALVGLAFAAILALILVPIYFSALGLEARQEWNHQHPNGPLHYQ